VRRSDLEDQVGRDSNQDAEGAPTPAPPPRFLRALSLVLAHVEAGPLFVEGSSVGERPKRDRPADCMREGRQYSSRVSGGGSVVLVDEATEAVAAVDLAHMRSCLWRVRVGRAKFKGTMRVGCAKSVHAARLYSWMSPLRRSRRSMLAGVGGIPCTCAAVGVGGVRFSARCVLGA
jgi:hypothetical protein